MVERFPIRIGEVIRNGVAFDFKNSEANLVDTGNLLQTVARLFALLRERQVDYVLVGGVALLQYVEGRNTQDIDLILSPAALASLPEIVLESQEPDFARGRFADLQIDLLLTRNALFEEVRRRYSAPRPFAEQTIPSATVEGLLLLKLYALPSLYRQGDFTRVGLYENDIAALLYAYRPAVEPLLLALVPHLGESDLVELRGILDEIRARIDRFDKGRQS